MTRDFIVRDRGVGWGNFRWGEGENDPRKDFMINLYRGNLHHPNTRINTRLTKNKTRLCFDYFLYLFHCHSKQTNIS